MKETTHSRTAPTNLLLAALALACATACVSGEDELTRVLAERQRAFPPSDAVIDLPAVGWGAGMGQLEALHETLRREQPERAIVEIGGAWCGPCRTRYPDFATAAERGGDADVLHLALGVESGAPDQQAVKHFVQHAWNAGLEPGFPAYAVLDARGRPLTTELFKSLAAAAVEAASGDERAASREANGASWASWASFNERLPRKPIEFEAETVGELAEQLRDQAGACLIVDERIASIQLHYAARSLPHGAAETLARGLPFERDVVTNADGEPCLVLWL